MSELKHKSKLNLLASKLLIEEKYYPSSIHCSYYSCFQILKYIINYFFGIEYDDIQNSIGKSKTTSHEDIIEFVFTEFEKLKIPEPKRFKRKIKDLKKLRIKADYDNIAITQDESENAYKLAIEFTEFINKNIQ